MEKVKVGGKDFEKICIIGKGGYGKVSLVRKVSGWDKGRLYAMKQMKKTTDIKRRGYFLNERKVLEQVRDEPFLATLQYAFESPTDLNIVLDYVNGGDMFTLLSLKGTLSEGHVKFYVGELVLALQHLHRLKIVHRDVKPENILLDSEGHVVLTDFGFSKSVSCEKVDRCGTTRYLAPEVIKCCPGERLGYPVDWWAVGVVTYEFLTRRSPFASRIAENSTEDVYRRILKNDPWYPITMSLDAREFVKALLTTDPNKRLGAHGAGEVKKHFFFNRLSWKDLAQKKIAPPFIPCIKNDLDVSNFAKEFTNMALEEPAEVTSCLRTCVSNNLCCLTRSSSELLKGFPYVPPAIHVTESGSLNSELPDTGMIEPLSATANARLLASSSKDALFTICHTERSLRSTASHSMTTEAGDKQHSQMSNSSRGSTASMGFTFRKGSDSLRRSTDCRGFAGSRGSSPSDVRVNFIVGPSSSSSLPSTRDDTSRTDPIKDPSGGNIRPSSGRATTISTARGRALSRVRRGTCPRTDEKAAEVESAVCEHTHELHDVDNMKDYLNIMAAAAVSCQRRREKKKSGRKFFTLPRAVFGCIKG